MTIDLPTLITQLQEIERTMPAGPDGTKKVTTTETTSPTTNPPTNADT